jgi:hypothetical protein
MEVSGLASRWCRFTPSKSPPVPAWMQWKREKSLDTIRRTVSTELDIITSHVWHKDTQLRRKQILAFPKQRRTGRNITNSETNHSVKYSGFFSQFGLIVSEDSKTERLRLNITCAVCAFYGDLASRRMREHMKITHKTSCLLSAFNETWTESTILLLLYLMLYQISWKSVHRFSNSDK